MRTLYLISSLLFFISISAQQTENKNQNNDSTKTKTELDSIKLSEVVVTADNIRFENGKVVMTPTKQAKKLANNISSLIENMNTGVLNVINGEIKTASGLPVSLFINGEPVDKYDKATFWAKNVVKVEYLPLTDESQFQGQNNVVNIVMKEYVAGGVTRLNGFQQIPNSGDYTAALKFVIRKLTFNAMLKGGYERDKYSSEIKTENYSNVWYDNKFHRLIQRTERNAVDKLRNNISAGMNARYSSTKFITSHSFEFNSNKEPRATTQGTVQYKPELISDDWMKHLTTAKNYFYALNGNYTYKFNAESILSMSWKLSISKNASSSTYKESDENSIITNVNETVKNLNYILMYYRNFSNKINANIVLNENITNYNTLYSGDTDSRQKQINYETTIKSSIFYEPIEQLAFSFRPQLIIFSRKLNKVYCNTNILPSAELQAYYSINNKSSLAFGAHCWLTSPNSSAVNDLILRQTELKWIEGNPSLKPSINYHFYVSYNIVPINWTTIRVDGGYSIENDITYLSYRSGERDYDGIVGEYINGIHENNYNAAASIIFKPFKGKINLSSQLNFVRHNANNVYSKSVFTPNFGVSIYLGNWLIRSNIYGEDKLMMNGGTMRVKTPWKYNLHINYGNGSINCELGIYNLFNKVNYQNIFYKSGPYNYNSKINTISNMRHIILSLTYTFDYGKKVDRSINISSSNNATTSILGSK